MADTTSVSDLAAARERVQQVVDGLTMFARHRVEYESMASLRHDIRILLEEIAPLSSLGDGDDSARLELIQLRRACYALTVALAKRILSEWNAENAAKGEPNNWPAQQTWDDLVGTSHSVLRRAAFRDAGLDEQAMVDLLFPNGYPAEGMVDDES